MSAVEQGLQAQIRNIEATYGKPMSEWLAIVAATGLTKHTEVVGMLKADYGMNHGAAHRVSLVARQASARRPPPAMRPIRSAFCIRARKQLSVRCTMP
jgi:hypothetical protein